MRCWLPKGTTHSGAGPRRLEAVQHLRLCLRLGGRERVEVGLAAEVQELDREPALHREQRRDRRVDAAGQQRRPRGRWCRPAARPRPRSRARARRPLRRPSRCAARAPGRLRFTGRAVRACSAAPISRSSCCEVSGKDLSRRRTRTAKVSRLRARRTRSSPTSAMRSTSRSQRRHTDAIAKPNTRSSREATSSATSSSGTGITEHRAAALDARVDARERGLQVAAQRVQELAPVASLERRLADLREHADGRVRPESADRPLHGCMPGTLSRTISSTGAVRVLPSASTPKVMSPFDGAPGGSFERNTGQPPVRGGRTARPQVPVRARPARGAGRRHGAAREGTLARAQAQRRGLPAAEAVRLHRAARRRVAWEGARELHELQPSRGSRSGSGAASRSPSATAPSSSCSPRRRSPTASTGSRT